MRIRTSPLLTIAGLAACLTSVAEAQTKAYTTFGPGDSHGSSTAFVVGNASSWTGVRASPVTGFKFTLGSPASLDFFRLALYSTLPSAPVVAHFFEGDDILARSLVETWAPISVAPEGAIYTFTSVLHPTLSPGELYWIGLERPDDGTSSTAAWDFNDQGIPGTVENKWGITVIGTASFGDATDWSWTDTAPVFDVYVNPDSSLSVTPEPVSMVLLSTGLIGVGIVALYRPRRV